MDWTCSSTTQTNPNPVFVSSVNVYNQRKSFVGQLTKKEIKLRRIRLPWFVVMTFFISLFNSSIRSASVESDTFIDLKDLKRKPQFDFQPASVSCSLLSAVVCVAGSRTRRCSLGLLVFNKPEYTLRLQTLCFVLTGLLKLCRAVIMSHDSLIWTFLTPFSQLASGRQMRC